MPRQQFAHCVTDYAGLLAVNAKTRGKGLIAIGGDPNRVAPSRDLILHLELSGKSLFDDMCKQQEARFQTAIGAMLTTVRKRGHLLLKPRNSKAERALAAFCRAQYRLNRAQENYVKAWQALRKESPNLAQ